MSSRRSGNRARCQFDGCEKFAQTRGLCKAHGGGSRCRDPSCNKLAQSRGLCIAHGGGRRCQSEGCLKLAQSKGFCISHGGGRRCTVPNCEKFSQVKGRCKSHSKLPDAMLFAVTSPRIPDEMMMRRMSSSSSSSSRESTSSLSRLDPTKHSISFLVNPLARSFSAGSIERPRPYVPSHPHSHTSQSPVFHHHVQFGQYSPLPSLSRTFSDDSLKSFASASTSSQHSDQRFPQSPDFASSSPLGPQSHPLPFHTKKYGRDQASVPYTAAACPAPTPTRFLLGSESRSIRSLSGVPLTSFLAPRDSTSSSSSSQRSQRTDVSAPTSPSIVLPSLAQLHMR